MSGTFTRIYSDAQKRAVASAMVDAKDTAKIATARLSAGELTDPESGQTVEPPPQVMPESYAYELSRKERGRRTGDGPSISDPLEAIDDLASRMVRLARREIAKLEKSKTPDLKRAKEATGLLRETRALVKGVAPSTGTHGRAARKKDGPQPDEPTSEAGKLLRKHRASARGQGQAAPHAQASEREQAHAHATERQRQRAGDTARAGGPHEAQDQAERAARQRTAAEQQAQAGRGTARGSMDTHARDRAESNGNESDIGRNGA